MTFTLELLHSEETESRQSPDAWFIAGTSVEDWLESLAQAGMATEDTLLFIATHKSDQTPQGVWAVVPKATVPRDRSPGMPFIKVGANLFVPRDSHLHPPVTALEADRLCEKRNIFMHPVLGTVAFDPDQALHVWDLLIVPQTLEESWDQACDTSSNEPHDLHSINLLPVPAQEDPFGPDTQDIGSKPPTLLTPPSQDVDQKFHSGSMAEKAADWLSRKLPDPGSVGSTSDRIPNPLRKLAESLQTRREQKRLRELEKLADLLDTDPDAGLQQAISLKGTAHRGTTAPGDTLGIRNPDLHLNSLSGGAADPWDLPPEMVHRLRTRYRSLADHELAMGRYRRAAYIHAHLLGEFRSAANALCQGGFFREAALLYEKYIHDSREAARCYAEAGCVHEAAMRYNALGQFERAAEVYEKHGCDNLAREFWIRALEDHRARRNHLGAAVLLREKLKDSEAALKELAAAWPSEPQAMRCLGMRLEWLQAMGRWEQIETLVLELRDHSCPDRFALEYTRALEPCALACPETSLRPLFADAIKLTAARFLKTEDPDPGARRQMLERLTRLEPSDRLLPRDCARWSDLNTRGKPLNSRAPRIAHTFSLQGAVRWRSVRASKHSFFAIGETSVGGILTEATWHGSTRSLSIPMTPRLAEPPRFSVLDGDATRVLLLDSRFPNDWVGELAAMDLFSPFPCQVSRPAMFPDEACLAAVTPEGISMIRNIHHEWISSRWSNAGALLTEAPAHGFPECEPAALLKQNPHPTAWMDCLPIALGNRLYLMQHGIQARVIECNGIIRAAFAARFAAKSLLILLEKGAAIARRGYSRCVELGSEEVWAAGTILENKYVVLVSESGEGRVFVADQGFGQYRLETSFRHEGARCIAVLAADNGKSFGCISERGEVVVRRLPT